MAMALEPDYRNRILRLFEEEGFKPDDPQAAFDECDRRVAEKRQIPHSLHFDVTDETNGSRAHLRVLVWRSPEWRRRRLACYRDHQALERAVEADSSFQVPPFLRHSSASLVWDVTRFVPGVNLPWKLDRPNGLHLMLDRVPTMVNIAQDLGRVRLVDIQARKLDRFVQEMGQLSAWSVRWGLMTTDQRTIVMAEARRLVSETVPTLGLRLSHGDFGPNNVLFAYASKALVDRL